MAVKLAKCGYIMTMPFVYLTNVIEWFRDNSGVWEVFSYIIVSIATLMYIGSKTEDIGAAILVVIALLYFGLYSLVLLIMQFVVNVLIDVVCLICYACSAINRACYTYMSSCAGRKYEDYKRHSRTSGTNGTYNYNHAHNHTDNNGNRSYSESDGNECQSVLLYKVARVNEIEYNERYEALVSRYEETERRRDELADQINQIMIRRRKLERFIETVEALPELYTEFDAGQWAALVDSMTVHAKDQITFTLTCGMEVEE